ncbi:MAG: hypothetical protein ACXWAV_04760, partial [Chthoniobacterales bacterium]
MLKSVLFLLTSVFCALNLQAQTEPQKTKPLSGATPPPVSSQQVDKNPPPIDVKNMDTSVRPEDDFYL